jgi:hypothetical protein
MESVSKPTLKGLTFRVWQLRENLVDTVVLFMLCSISVLPDFAHGSLFPRRCALPKARKQRNRLGLRRIAGSSICERRMLAN